MRKFPKGKSSCPGIIAPYELLKNARCTGCGRNFRIRHYIETISSTGVKRAFACCHRCWKEIRRLHAEYPGAAPYVKFEARFREISREEALVYSMMAQ